MARLQKTWCRGAKTRQDGFRQADQGQAVVGRWWLVGGVGGGLPPKPAAKHCNHCTRQRLLPQPPALHPALIPPLSAPLDHLLTPSCPGMSPRCPSATQGPGACCSQGRGQGADVKSEKYRVDCSRPSTHTQQQTSDACHTQHRRRYPALQPSSTASAPEAAAQHHLARNVVGGVHVCSPCGAHMCFPQHQPLRAPPSHGHHLGGGGGAGGGAGGCRSGQPPMDSAMQHSEAGTLPAAWSAPASPPAPPPTIFASMYPLVMMRLSSVSSCTQGGRGRGRAGPSQLDSLPRSSAGAHRETGAQ